MAPIADRDPGVTPRQLLFTDEVGHEVDAAAAVLLGKAGRGVEAEGVRLAHHVPRGLLVLVVALGDRAHLLLGELVRERADLLLFAG